MLQQGEIYFKKSAAQSVCCPKKKKNYMADFHPAAAKKIWA